MYSRILTTPQRSLVKFVVVIVVVVAVFVVVIHVYVIKVMTFRNIIFYWFCVLIALIW